MSEAASPVCPCCNNADLRPALQRRLELQLPEPLAILQCADCGHNLMHPTPSHDELSKFYAAAPGYDDTTMRGRYDDALQREWQTVLRTFRDRLGGGSHRLLDFGCAQGGFLEEAKKAGFDTVGYEPTDRLAQAARARGLDVCSDSDLDAVSIADHSVDIIYTSHVIEHVTDPRATLAWCRRKLRPQGLLFLQVPNQFRDMLWPLLHKRWIARGKPLGYHLHHLQFFTPRSLNRLLQAGDMRVEALSTHFGRSNRRTVAQGRLGPAKRLIYGIAGRFGRGPHIEALATPANTVSASADDKEVSHL